MRKTSYFDVQSRVAFLRGLNPSKVDFEIIRDRVGRLIDSYPWKIVPIRASGVFRARLNDGEAFFSNVSELWYPPAEYAKQGRFNNRNDPVFYASSQFDGAVLEVQPSVGKTVTVLLARTSNLNTPLSTAEIGMSHCLVPALKERTPDQISPLYNRTWRLIDEWISEVATGDPTNYAFTNALSHYLRQCPYLDGFQYPSVATALKAVNLVLPADRANRLLVPDVAYTLKIDQKFEHPKTGEPRHQIEISHRSLPIGSDGRLEWVPVGQQELPNYISHTQYGEWPPGS